MSVQMSDAETTRPDSVVSGPTNAVPGGSGDNHDHDNDPTQPSSSSSSSISSSSSSAASSPLLTQVAAAVSKMRTAAGGKADVFAASLKAIAKMLTAIAAKPSDRKLRQHRLDNIILKKYVVSVSGALDLVKLLGFSEQTLEGKQYLTVEETEPAIAEYDSVADSIVAAASAPASVPMADPSAPTSSSASTTSSAPAAPRQPCVKNCGFFGDARTANMCSKCYKESQSPAVALPSATKSAATSSASSSSSSAAAAKETTAQQRSTSARRTPRERLRYAFVKTCAMYRFNKGKRPVQEHRDRCWVCQRRLHLSGVECRCGYVFCGKHRYADEHECRYNHQKRHQSSLAQLNQKVQGQKLERISDD